MAKKKHSDEKEDIALIKKEVKKEALKPQKKNAALNKTKSAMKKVGGK